MPPRGSHQRSSLAHASSGSGDAMRLSDRVAAPLSTAALILAACLAGLYAWAGIESVLARLGVTALFPLSLVYPAFFWQRPATPRSATTITAPWDSSPRPASSGSCTSTSPSRASTRAVRARRAARRSGRSLRDQRWQAREGRVEGGRRSHQRAGIAVRVVGGVSSADWPARPRCRPSARPGWPPRRGRLPR